MAVKDVKADLLLPPPPYSKEESERLKLRSAFESLPDIDEEIIDWLVQLNRYKGITTTTSCAGHSFEDIRARGGARGRSLIPYVELFFESSRIFSLFCAEVARLGEKSHIAITIEPPSRNAYVEPVAKTYGSRGLQGCQGEYKVPMPAGDLRTIRGEMFNQVVEILDDIAVKENDLEKKVTTIKVLCEESRR